MKATWLLQGSFLFESEGFRLLVDPYISDFVEKKQGLRRLAPPPLKAEELKPGFIYCTHNHIDHLDPVGLPEILALNKGCRLSGPSSVAAKCATLGIEGAEIVRIGESFNAGPFALTPVKAFHSDPESTGLLIEEGGLLVYLSGDTEWKEELAKLVLEAAGRTPDVAIICVNGKLGNMDAAHAVETVKALGVKTAIPMHYGLFAENTADPAEFTSSCKAAGLDSFALKPGAPCELSRKGRA